MTPEILINIFPHKESNYNLRNSTVLQDRTIKTVIYGSESVSSLRQEIWDILPKKKLCLLTLFANKIRE